MKFAIFLILTLVAPAAFAQVHAAHGRSAPKPAYHRQQPYDAMAKDTTPFNCEKMRGQSPLVDLERMCRDIESDTLRNVAVQQGKPAPSRTVIELPALGTPEAKKLGYACIGGQAMRRLANGWEQVMAKAGGWQRCVGG